MVRKQVGWTKNKSQQIRPIRDRKHGLMGQEIWFKLQSLGFVTDEKYVYMGSKYQLTKFEKKLKNWLIWGYWEEL